MDLFFPEAGLSGIRLLQREGLRVIFPQGQTCCAQPAFNCGYREEARAVARAQIALFREPYPIVVPSGSCAGMMKRHYPALFEGDPLRGGGGGVRVEGLRADAVPDRRLNVKLTDRGEKVRVTWHSSCHALREMGIVEEPRSLLAQLANVELAPLSRETGVLRLRRDVRGPRARDLGGHGRGQGRPTSWRRALRSSSRETAAAS